MITCSNEKKIPVSNIQRFCTHDGPGIRTTVFLAGCPLDCLWCHNPEMKNRKLQILYTSQRCIKCKKCVFLCPKEVFKFSENGEHLIFREKCDECLICVNNCPTEALEPSYTMMSIHEIIDEAIKDAPFYGKNGGVTLSGGEPLLYTEEAIEILRFFKDKNISTAIETSGYFNENDLLRLVDVVDLFLWDYKDSDPKRHIKNTGVNQDIITKNLFLTDKHNTSIILRCIMIKNINMNEDHYGNIARVYSCLTHCEGVELIPCHILGDSKNIQLGVNMKCDDNWIPSIKEIKNVQQKLIQKGVHIINKK